MKSEEVQVVYGVLYCADTVGDRSRYRDENYTFAAESKVPRQVQNGRERTVLSKKVRQFALFPPKFPVHYKGAF